MKLSIIVCVHNTREDSFLKCLDSIYNSTLNDYEVIVIDDGSYVDYKEIIKKYSPVYVKTQNRGQLASRMYGLLLAKGEYVAYVDSDDSVTFNYHEPMVNLAIKNNCDIVMNDWAFKTENGYSNYGNDEGVYKDVKAEGKDILKYFAKDQGKYRTSYVLWNKVFKKSLLLSAKAEIEKTDAIMNKQTYAEDILVSFFACKNAKKMENIHTGYYFFDVSIPKLPKEEVLKANVKMTSDSFDIILKSLSENGAFEEVAENIREWKNQMCQKHIAYAVKNGYAELVDYIKAVYGASSQLNGKLDSQLYPDMPLGSNLEEIDTLLRWIYKKGRDVCVNYDKNDKYVASSLQYIQNVCGINLRAGDESAIIIPKRNIALKDKLACSKFGIKLRSLFKKS